MNENTLEPRALEELSHYEIFGVSEEANQRQIEAEYDRVSDS